MIYVYASRTGNVAALIEKLRIEAMPISDGNERVEEDYILFTYTDGYGDIPMEVDTFLQNNPTHIKGVVCSGDTSYGEAFCGAGVKIAETYSVPLLCKVEMDGTEEDVKAIQAMLRKVNQ